VIDQLTTMRARGESYGRVIILASQGDGFLPIQNASCTFTSSDV
jgi:hypothetical protein